MGNMGFTWIINHGSKVGCTSNSPVTARMLLSMEISPSGLNLTVAHHVILAQPTVRGEYDEAVPRRHRTRFPRMEVPQNGRFIVENPIYG